MKNFIINLFRNHPICTGLLSLLIALNLVGVNDIWTPMMLMQDKLFSILFFYVCSMLCFMLCILPEIKQEKREKITWIVVASMVVVLTIVAKFFME